MVEIQIPISGLSVTEAEQSATVSAGEDVHVSEIDAGGNHWIGTGGPDAGSVAASQWH